MSDLGVSAAAATDSPGDTVLSRLSLELTLLSRHFPATRRNPGCRLDRSAFLILTRLRLGDPLTLRELAETFKLDISTINRQVGAMLDQGLVDRVPDPEGGIARKIRPSVKGLELLAGDLVQNHRGLEKVVADWPDEDVEQLSRLVERFNESVERLERNPWPRPTRER